MLNYIKSECYRMRVGKGLYLAIGLLGGAVLAMNVLLAVSGRSIADFRYDTVRFSLNTFTALSYAMVVLGAVVPGSLFLDDRRNGVMKNVIASGLSREKLFIGKCIVSFMYTFIILCAVLAIYVGSAYALLREPEWLPLREMLTGIAAALPSAAGSLVCVTFLNAVFRKEFIVGFSWVVVYYMIPSAVFLIGFKVKLFERIASWMPYIFLRKEALVTYDGYYCLWDTPEGMAKCVIAGLLGIAVFTVIGLWRFKKLEI